MVSRKALAALRQSSLEIYRLPSASSFWYSSPDCVACRACASAASRFSCHPSILPRLTILPHPLVKCPVQHPRARVRRAVLAAEVRRRQLLIEAHIADRMLLTLVVHV
eukprot:scaffold21671_cov63-Phaeocystis_antarctica.AAC.3